MTRNVILILAAIALWVGWDSFFILQESEQAIVTQFGLPKKTYRSPGIRAKIPFADTVRRLEKRIMGSDTAPAEYLTLDKKRLVADPISRWRITDPLRFYKSVHDESGAKARLDDIVNSELREQIASQNFGEIIGNKREDLVQKVSTRARKQLSPLGIELVDVRIKRADLPAEVQESVFQRMRAERDRIAKRYRSEGEEEAEKIRAETDKQKSIILAEAYEKAQEIRGEGDAKSTAIYADAYQKDPEFYGFVRSLATYERVIDPSSNVVLSTDNDLLKYMSSTE